MHLRRLEVHGFKAFAAPQRFDFGPGMTTIVGPNGSGKSNVADAIRWALGEQSSRQIRARRNEDVIFSGSDRRRPMGMAEVTLYLDNSEGWMPVDFAEVSVTRRAHRNGDSEYLINGQKVRLADVIDLFRRAEVGQNSYAIMSQGLVDEVLALRPAERRGLIEEAADVRRHREQLNRSERRLVETRDNLDQVRMLIREVEPRLRQLARQSKRAARYRELAAELSDALQVYFEAEMRSAQEGHTAARARHDQQSQAFVAAREALQAVERRLETIGESVVTGRAELEVVQQRERSLAEEGLRLEQAVALAEQRLELLELRRGELESAIEATAPVTEQDEADRDRTIDGELTALDARAAEAEQQLMREREALTAADQATRAVLRELGESEARRARLGAEHDDAERRLREHDSRTERVTAEREQADQRLGELLAELKQYGREVHSHGRRGRVYEQVAAEARRRRDLTEQALEDRQREVQTATDELRSAESSINQLEERQRMIEQIAGAVPAAGEGAQALLRAATDPIAPQDGGEAEPLQGVIDTVSRLIHVPAGLEAAIESALAEQLSAIVVERSEDALAAIEYLREHGAGTATLLPLDSMTHLYPLNLFNERGVVGIAARLVRCEQRYRPLVDTLLGRVIVVEDVRVARQMVTRGLGSVVTRDGLLLRADGAAFGGRSGVATEQFSLQREIEGLPEQVEAMRRGLVDVRTKVHEAGAALQQARSAVASARRSVDENEQRQRTHAGEFAGLRHRQARLSTETRAVRATLTATDSGESVAALRGRMEQAAAGIATVEATIARLRDRSAAVGEERDAASGRLTEATTVGATVEAERRTLRTQREERLTTRRAELERRTQLETQLRELLTETEDLGLSLQDRRARLANSRSTLAEAQAAVGPAHTSLADVVTEERELTTARTDAQNTRLQAERELMGGESTLREQAARVQRLDEEIAEESMELLDDGSVRPRPAAPENIGAAPVGPPTAAEHAVASELAELAAGEQQLAVVRGGATVDLPVLRERIGELRGSIRALGPVNVDALEDLSEEEERHDFLVQQVADLEAAEEELRAAIRELRTLIRGRFDETFVQVNERFGEYFSRFFGGGVAELRLLENEENDDEPGVEIFAQPPGKRISNLNVLSGGERSMTSVALLFALLSVNPAPIVVLDEVDAALDDANVGRFLETLRELRELTQFVVITHNRRTIEASDAIYGISMGEDSTSQVLSLRLGEVAAPA